MPIRIRASVVCVSKNRMLLVRLQDPLTKVERLFPPGGEVENDETPPQAACRETLEETGYAVQVNSNSVLVVNYPFLWGGRTYQCRTHFFSAELCAPEVPPSPVCEGLPLCGVEWLPLSRVSTELGFHQEILESVTRLLPLP